MARSDKHRAWLIIQIDGIHIKDDLMLLAAVGIDGDGKKHPLGVGVNVYRERQALT